jgi:hypothetical protein
MSVRAFDLLTADEVSNILTQNTGALATAQANTGDKVRFGMEVPDQVREKLSAALGLPLTNPVPAQLVRGETARHVDVGTEAFQQTHLVYLTDSEGSLVIGDAAYPIATGKAYVFQQGLAHGTEGATSERVSLGPFNEHQRYVGICFGYYIYTEGYVPGEYTFAGCICNNDPTFTIVDYSTLAGAVVPAGYIFAGWSTSEPPTTVDYTVGQSGVCTDIDFNLYPVFVSSTCSPSPPVTQPYKMDNTTLTEIQKSKVIITTGLNKQQNTAASRTEQIKARVLAARCCRNC